MLSGQFLVSLKIRFSFTKSIKFAFGNKEHNKLELHCMETSYDCKIVFLSTHDPQHCLKQFSLIPECIVQLYLDNNMLKYIET